MATVTISSTYRFVIPKEVRESLALHPGQKLQAIVYEGRLELIPVRPVRDLRGSLVGLDSTVPRETDRA